MDKKLRKDQTAVELKFKDRGDSRKFRNKTKVDIEVQVSNKYLENDRGDSPDKTEKPLDVNTAAEPKSTTAKEKTIAKVAQNRNNLSERGEKTRNEIKCLDITKKRKLAQMYTFRWHVDNTSTLGLKKNESQQNKTGVEHASRVEVAAANPRTKSERNTESKSHKIQVSTKDPTDNHAESSLDRKPVIKTVTCKNDAARVFKAVTFVDKKRNVTALKIDIPRRSDAVTISPKSESPRSRPGSSVKENYEKSPNRSIKGKRKRGSSPELAGPQPVITEVAKWAPMSVNQLTQPYYEAWVDTTLTAFSRESKSEKLSLARQAFENIKTKQIISAIDQEEMLKELRDEKYTGRIRVKHRISKR